MNGLPVWPSWVIVVPLLAATVLSVGKYYARDPVNRLTDRHFLLAVGSLLCVGLYLSSTVVDPDNALLSTGFVVVAFALFALAFFLFRRKPSVPAPTAGFRIG